MQKLGRKSYLLLAKKSFRQILHKYKIIHNKIFTTYLCVSFGKEVRQVISHKISKIQLDRTCRLWDTTDLGFSVLYFSCKIYQEKQWSCFTKIVVFFTRSPKNWVCIFLFFYHFLQILQLSAKRLILLTINFSPSPLGFSEYSQNHPCFTFMPLQRFRT
jgi:hypothetical protein